MEVCCFFFVLRDEKSDRRLLHLILRTEGRGRESFVHEYNALLPGLYNTGVVHRNCQGVSGDSLKARHRICSRHSPIFQLNNVTNEDSCRAIKSLCCKFFLVYGVIRRHLNLFWLQCNTIRFLIKNNNSGVRFRYSINDITPEGFFTYLQQRSLMLYPQQNC